MHFYDSPEDEAAAIRRAAARVGCRVRTVVVGPQQSEGVGREAFAFAVVRGELSCKDGWQAARLLLALAEEDSLTSGARELAAEMRATAPDDAAFARAIHARVGRLQFIRERGEIFQNGALTLARDGGDCDDHFRLAYALARAGGLDARLGVLYHGAPAPKDKRGPAHAVALLCPDGVCTWAETTIAARFGEPPNDAARRLGLTNERSDIAREVVVMGNRDLPPVPAGFRDHNKPAQVAIDSQALQRLGYLGWDVPASVASDPTSDLVRQAVAHFQADHHLQLVDGLLGLVTRSTLAHELQRIGPPVTDAFDYVRLSGLVGAAPIVPLFTHAQARATLADAYRALLGSEPSAGELDFGTATAYFETGYGRAGAADWVKLGQFARWARDGKINWGALESGVPGEESTLQSFRNAGLHPTKEKGADAGRAVYFYLFPNDLEAATAFLMSWGRKDRTGARPVLDAAATGQAFAVSAAMKSFGYYEGFHVPPGNPRHQPVPPFVVASSAEEAERLNISDYANALERNRRVVTGTGGVPDPSSPTFPGARGASAAIVAGLLTIVGSVGALAWWVART
ncbi:MAG: hypothetical protein JWL95_3266 [Gemmatimonadetes bacterium]|nr:hypothetical protein [Gemmatimonadota bacterium]